MYNENPLSMSFGHLHSLPSSQIWDEGELWGELGFPCEPPKGESGEMDGNFGRHRGGAIRQWRKRRFPIPEKSGNERETQKLEQQR